jgi:hypothetical protein
MKSVGKPCLQRGPAERQSASRRAIAPAQPQRRRAHGILQSLSRLHEPGSEPAEGQPLLQQFAGIFGEDHRAGRALCVAMCVTLDTIAFAVAAVFAISRGRQKAVNVAGAALWQVRRASRRRQSKSRSFSC